VGITFTLFYGWGMRCTPIHMLTMRRLVPVILPMAVIMISYVLSSMAEGADRLSGRYSPGKWVVRIAVGGLLLYLVLFSANASIPIFGLQEGGNQLEVTGDISKTVEEDAVILMDYHLGDLFGPPLRSFYGIENGWIMDNSILEEEEFSRLLDDLGFPSRPVYLLWRPAMSGAEITTGEGIELVLTGDYLSREEVLEKSFENRPSRREHLEDEIWLFRIIPESSSSSDDDGVSVMILNEPAAP
jgi:hypothetical protein